MAFQHYSQFWTYEKNAHLKFGKPHFLAISNIISFFFNHPIPSLLAVEVPPNGEASGANATDRAKELQQLDDHFAELGANMAGNGNPIDTGKII